METGRARMARLFREQADGCGRLGSPLYAGLLAHAGDDIDRGGLLADVLAGHEDDSGPSALALRLAGAVHRLVLAGRAPELADYYPSVGGVANAEGAWPHFRQTVADNAAEIRTLLVAPPQTNEVGRAAVLIGALLQLSAAYRWPIRLLEIGASAGLNRRVDAFRYELAADLVVGDPASAVVLRRPWSSPAAAWPPTAVTTQVVERRGCDPDPADPSSIDGQLRLASYVWPDQVERLARLRGAFAVAAQVPAVVEKATAAEFLTRQLSDLGRGVMTVVWHSVLWQYLGAAERSAVLELLASAGSRATDKRLLAHVAFEPVRPTPDRRYAFHATMTV